MQPAIQRQHISESKRSLHNHMKLGNADLIMWSGSSITRQAMGLGVRGGGLIDLNTGTLVNFSAHDFTHLQCMNSNLIQPSSQAASSLKRQLQSNAAATYLRAQKISRQVDSLNACVL